MSSNKNQMLPSGAIIHWGEKTETNSKGRKKAFVTCGICKLKRFVSICLSSKKGWSGNCRRCNSTGSKGLKGKESPTYKGEFISKQGYIFLLISCLPLEERKLANQMKSATHNYIAEHRFIMAKHLKRPLTSNEVVHHLNEIKDDNRIENLTLTSKSSHGSEHQSILSAARSEIKRLQSLLENAGIEY